MRRWASSILLGQPAGQVGDALLELLDGLLELLDLGLGVGEEAVQQIGELVRVGEVGFEDAVAVLEEDGAAGVLEDGVGERVAAADLALDLAGEVVAGVLGLPVAAGDAVGVAEGAVGADGVAAGFGAELGDEGPAVEAGGVREEIPEGVAEGQFMFDALRAGLGEGAVVFADEGMRGRDLDGAPGHGLNK